MVREKMQRKEERCKEKSTIIDEIGITPDKLKFRRVLVLFARHLCNSEERFASSLLTFSNLLNGAIHQGIKLLITIGKS